MADNLTSPAMKPLNSTPLGTLSGSLQGGLNSLISQGSGILDRFFPPERRNELKAKLTKFATEKPHLASFLFSQIAISGLPLAIFAVFTVGIFVFALLVALILALLGAVLFTVAMVGFALIILFPVLFVTTFSAAFIWLWGLAAYYIIKWFNEKPVPGVHSDLKGGLMEQTGMNRIWGGFNDAMTDAKMPAAHEQDPSRRTDVPQKDQPQQQQNQQEDHDTSDEKSHQPPKLQTKPKPQSEKQNGTTKQHKTESSPAATTRSPVRNATKATGAEHVGNAGGELKKKSTAAVGGVTNAAGINV